MKLIDEAVQALDEMDGLVSSYKIQLNVSYLCPSLLCFLMYSPYPVPVGRQR